MFLPVFNSLAEHLISKVLSRYLDPLNKHSSSSYYVKGTMDVNNIRGSSPAGNFGMNGGGMHVDSGTPDHQQYGTSWSRPCLLGVPISVPLHLPVAPSLQRLLSPQARAGRTNPCGQPLCLWLPCTLKIPSNQGFRWVDANWNVGPQRTRTVSPPLCNHRPRPGLCTEKALGKWVHSRSFCCWLRGVLVSTGPFAQCGSHLLPGGVIDFSLRAWWARPGRGHWHYPETCFQRSAK